MEVTVMVLVVPDAGVPPEDRRHFNFPGYFVVFQDFYYLANI